MERCHWDILATVDLQRRFAEQRRHGDEGRITLEIEVLLELAMKNGEYDRGNSCSSKT